jgi:hypothetical protein
LYICGGILDAEVCIPLYSERHNALLMQMRCRVSHEKCDQIDAHNVLSSDN